MTHYDALDILDALIEWHHDRATQAPRPQARKLLANALAIERARNDMFPITIQRITDETENRWN
jgi:hypothetical protein